MPSPLIARLPPIGFGAFKIGRNQGIKYAASYELPTDDEARAILNGVLDAGCRYIDTAPAYGISEARIGQFLASRRAEFILSTKVGETFVDGVSTYDFSESAILSSLERSRERLHSAVLDLVFIHAPANDLAVLRETPVVKLLEAERSRGSIQAIGFSGKTVAAAEAALDWADALMMEYHADDQSHAAVMTRAAERGIGVIVKKGLASGRFPAATAIPFALSHPAVTSLVIGGLNLHHFRENLRIGMAAR